MLKGVLVVPDGGILSFDDEITAVLQQWEEHGNCTPLHNNFSEVLWSSDDEQAKEESAKTIHAEDSQKNDKKVEEVSADFNANGKAPSPQSMRKEGNGSFKRRAKLHEAEAANVLTQHIIMSDELRRRQREARLLQLVRDLARIGVNFQMENERLNSEVKALRKSLAEAKPFEGYEKGSPRSSPPLPVVPECPMFSER